MFSHKVGLGCSKILFVRECQFDLITDYSLLKWMAQKNRWVNLCFLALKDYSFTVKHSPSVKKVNVDALSWVHSCWATGVPTLGFKQKGGDM